MNGRRWIISGALLGALSVVIGAFGAHGLDHYLTEHGQAGNYETAVRYQMYHALALVVVGLLAERRASKALSVAGGCFIAGVALFSGSLYAIALAGLRQLGMVAPIGGTLLIIGWLAMAAAAMQATRSER